MLLSESYAAKMIITKLWLEDYRLWSPHNNENVKWDDCGENVISSNILFEGYNEKVELRRENYGENPMTRWLWWLYYDDKVMEIML